MSSSKVGGNVVKKIWDFMTQLVILVIIYQISNFIAQYFHLKTPGNVVGIIVLFILLHLGIIKMEKIELASGWLLKHLGFFFIPISVGLMTLGDVLIKKGISILIVLLISTMIGLIFAGKVTQAIIMKKEKGNVKYHDHAL